MKITIREVDESPRQVRERKVKVLLVGIVTVLGLAMIVTIGIPLYQSWREQNRPVADYGVVAAEAGCGEVIDDAAGRTGVHVGPGTASPDVTRVDYETAPPSSGPHFDLTSGFRRSFYARGDTPPVEMLVHDLEHGATIVWYDDALPGDEFAQLEEIAGAANRDTVGTPMVIVAAWDPERGDFPTGSVAMSHWSRDTGHRQYCDRVSGEVIAAFIEAFPSTDAPEHDAG